MIHLFKARKGNSAIHFWFHITARNGKILLTSETYKTKRSALKAISSLLSATKKAKYQDHTIPTKNTSSFL